MIQVIFHFNRGDDLVAYVTSAAAADIDSGKVQAVRAFKSDTTDSGDNHDYTVRYWSLNYVERP